MTDRELLEMAGKAAGLTLTWGEVFQVGGDTVDCSDLPYVVSDDREEAPCYWNPLEDDGDALRLAVKLRINIYNAPDRGACASFWLQDIDHVIYCNEKDRDAAATRRAIVRAAAEIGAKQ